VQRKKNKYPRGLCVLVENNSIEKALRIFKQKVKDSDLMLEIRQKSHYEKPSAKRRHRKNMAKLRERYRKMRED
jgi:small subunit ribosomal protein S21